MAHNAHLQATEGGRPARPFLVTCILTLNEESNISEAIHSVRGTCDAIVVVDSGSADRTAAVAVEEGAMVWRRDFDTEHQQRNWAAEAVEKEWPGAWILELDADERLTPALGAEIHNLLSSIPTHHAYLIKLRFVFDGRLLRFGGFSQTHVPRLRRTSSGRYEAREVNPHLILSPGRLGRLRGHVIHTDVASWERHIEKHNKYSSLEAKARLRAVDDPDLRIGTLPALRSPHLRRRWLREHVWNDLPAKPMLLFLNTYLLHVGWLDGLPGLRNAVFRSWQVMCTDLKYRELRGDVRLRDQITSQDTRDWEHYLRKQNEMTTLKALEVVKRDKGKQYGMDRDSNGHSAARRGSRRRVVWNIAPAKPLLRFMQTYLLSLLKGHPRLFVATMQTWAEMSVELKVEEFRKRAAKPTYP